tara:strand:- start:1703 stop:2311 length:609 start_codon:yes stop_codon:yes gene_type:complete
MIELLKEYWFELTTSLIFLGAGWAIGMHRAKRKWAKREFYDRLNVSLNILRDGKLKIRTLVEKSCEEVFLNAATTQAVTEAARRTNSNDSILDLPIDEYWFYLNSVLNEISEHFAAGYLKRDAGEALLTEKYLVCLTSEEAPEIRQRKVRAMMIRKDVLTQLPAEKPQFESPFHETRWKTLQQISAEYGREPRRFIEVEVCF